MFCQQLIDCAHELSPRVNLEELRPLQRSPPVNAGQCYGHLFGLFCSQRLSRFESAGDVDHGETSPEPHFQRPMLWLRDFLLPQCLSSNPWGCMLARRADSLLSLMGDTEKINSPINLQQSDYLASL